MRQRYSVGKRNGLAFRLPPNQVFCRRSSQTFESVARRATAGLSMVHGTINLFRWRPRVRFLQYVERHP